MLSIFADYYREVGGGQRASVAGVVEGGGGQPPPQGGDEGHLDQDQNIVFMTIESVQYGLLNFSLAWVDVKFDFSWAGWMNLVLKSSMGFMNGAHSGATHTKNFE